MNKAREFDQSVVAELKTLLGDRVSTSQAVREHHGKDESYFPYALPDVVVFVRTTEEVRDVVNICRAHRVPMVPYGVGTSLEGHILAVKGGVCIDLSQMNQVLEVHEADLDAVVQAGVTRKQLNEHIKHTGSSRSIRAPTRRWAAWRQRAPRARTRCATAPCARTCWA